MRFSALPVWDTQESVAHQHQTEGAAVGLQIAPTTRQESALAQTGVSAKETKEIHAMT